MRLKQIKLAGFKSFVDVTKVPFPQQMTAIVGPNGCGKSNIIDAVRWVLGESSAKNLRGDAMTDVIFNGSSERKPVGQASVELVFDNQTDCLTESQTEHEQAHQFNLTGSLAARNEISVKRSVNRDSTNHYFLNGSRCRRKDITDIFLGSGLGPKSYAIIEQGMISRLIESKPQELRVFVEEAAGVSKYKERRRDTELKLKHTAENLNRLSDISHEISIHLNVLQKQAALAKRYKTLKAEQRQLKLQLSTLTHQKLLDNLATIEKEYQALANQLAEHKRDLSQSREKRTIVESNIEQTYDDIALWQDKRAQSVQNQMLLQQQLDSAKVQRQRLEDKLTLSNQNKQQVLGKAQQLTSSVDALTSKIASNAPKLSKLAETKAKKANELQTSKARLNDLQASWHDQNNALITRKQQALIQHQQALESQQALVKCNASIDALQQQLRQLGNDQNEALKTFNEQLAQNESQQACQQQTISQLEEKQQQLDIDEKNIRQAIAEKQYLLLEKEAENKLVSTQLQQPVNWLKDAQAWLSSQHIEHNGEFHQYLTVKAKWQPAVNKVLGAWLSALVIADRQAMLKVPAEINQYWFIDKHKLTQHVVEGSLASIISSRIGVMPWLNDIQIADSVEQAVHLIAQSNSSSFVVCADGTLVTSAGQSKGGVDLPIDVLQLSYQQQQLFAEIAKLKNGIEALSGEQASSAKVAKKLETEKLAAKQQLDSLKLAKGLIEQNKVQVEQALAQKAQLLEKISILENERALLGNEQQQQAEPLSEQSFTESEQALAHLTSEIDSVKAVCFEQQRVLDECWRELQQLEHQQQLDTISLTQEQLQLSHANEQVAAIEQHIAQHKTELTALPDSSNLLNDLAQAKHAANDSQNKLDESERLLSEVKTHRAELLAGIERLEQTYANADALVHKKALKKEQLLFELEAIEKELQSLQQSENMSLALFPTQKSLSACQKALKDIEQQLSAIGVVNLAAIDEFELQQQRKNQIDLQIEDLSQALATLESAIAKIDKESRSKFKATFERINHDFSALFPKVFGGGSAYLALTSNELLDTGVSIMARPPGKKNSTIHLLSGGEKALTALSLVFAIFRLNPAPFCMLDEVDAPLDDANVERFCKLVKEMSKSVQFIYISHNKIAMEMASHLTGVTMVEPGVSRLVSVDIDEAIAMAEVS